MFAQLFRPVSKDKIFTANCYRESLWIFTFIASVYGVGESGATVWEPNLASEEGMLELLASLSDERLMSPWYVRASREMFTPPGPGHN